ncbi:hypothetical protein MRB53_042220 [Persea americana]|nr:hypothetical protein MRB53_042208 [Persea americana]KAJ8603253.1 hypothetical protein MRB53_042214 [Persea americana]KAJ8603259.1 hypothetical protein MRB53_042220 [Persea americana]
MGSSSSGRASARVGSVPVACTTPHAPVPPVSPPAPVIPAKPISARGYRLAGRPRPPAPWGPSLPTPDTHTRRLSPASNAQRPPSIALGGTPPCLPSNAQRLSPPSNAQRPPPNAPEETPLCLHPTPIALPRPHPTPAPNALIQRRRARGDPAFIHAPAQRPPSNALDLTPPIQRSRPTPHALCSSSNAPHPTSSPNACIQRHHPTPDALCPA